MIPGENGNKRVTFETDYSVEPSNYVLNDDPKLIRLVMKYSHGLIKNSTHAGYLVIGISILALAFSIILFTKSNRTNDPVTVPVPRNQFVPGN
jgi:hypothetical protein